MQEFAARRFFSQALSNAEKSLEGLGLLGQGEDSTGSDAVQNSRICSCLQQVVDVISDLITNPTPEEKRARTFQRIHLPLLRSGACMTLSEVNQASKGMLSMVSSSVGSLLSGSANTTSRAIGRPVMVNFHRESLDLKWATLELEKNSPIASGTVNLEEFQVVQHDEKKPLLFRIKDAKGATLLALEAEDERTKERWILALQEALSVLASEIQENKSSEDSLLRRQQRLMQLEMRKRERERQKRELDQKLGVKGYIQKS